MVHADSHGRFADAAGGAAHQHLLCRDAGHYRDGNGSNSGGFIVIISRSPRFLFNDRRQGAVEQFFHLNRDYGRLDFVRHLFRPVFANDGAPRSGCCRRVCLGRACFRCRNHDCRGLRRPHQYVHSIATFRAAEPLFGVKLRDGEYRRSFLFTGLFTVLSGIFCVVPYGPYTSSIGFLQTTRIYERAPFIIGSILFMLRGFVPHLASFFSTLPISVGNAVLFVAYLQLFGSALKNIEGISFNYISIFRLALPVLTGIAIMSVPDSSFSTINGFMNMILSNGMLVGILLSVLMENLLPWTKLEARARREA